MIKAIGEHIIAIDMERGERVTSGGIIVQDTIGKVNDDKAPRWFTVTSVGKRSGFYGELKKHDKILVDYGRWTVNIEVDGVKHWGIDPDGISAIEEV